MILVDTSIWIDHLHIAETRLVELLEHDEVAMHPLVVEELALGSIRNRAAVLDLLGNLRQLPVLSHAELLALADQHRLWGRGLSPVDAHLLGAVMLTPGAALWTRDRRLIEACAAVGVAVLDDPR